MDEACPESTGYTMQVRVTFVIFEHRDSDIGLTLLPSNVVRRAWLVPMASANSGVADLLV